MSMTLLDAARMAERDGALHCEMIDGESIEGTPDSNNLHVKGIVNGWVLVQRGVVNQNIYVSQAKAGRVIVRLTD